MGNHNFIIDYIMSDKSRDNNNADNRCNYLHLFQTYKHDGENANYRVNNRDL